MGLKDGVTQVGEVYLPWHRGKCMLILYCTWLTAEKEQRYQFTSKQTTISCHCKAITQNPSQFSPDQVPADAAWLVLRAIPCICSRGKPRIQSTDKGTYRVSRFSPREQHQKDKTSYMLKVY